MTLHETHTDIQNQVKDYYGKVLQSKDDLKSNACCTTVAPPPWLRPALDAVPREIAQKYYGCGSPFPEALTGISVLDLGSGSGRDCYAFSQLVGEEGQVIGLDMTDEQLDVARKHIAPFTKALGYTSPNLEFRKGYIEMLEDAGIENESLDLVVSNCVLNLSPRKDLVLAQVYKALKPGGEFYFSDIYCDRRLPVDVMQDPELYGECLGGALYLQDFIRLAHQAGFTDPRMVQKNPVEAKDDRLKALVGPARFCAITFRLFKLPSLETLCEDYGQVATYKGTIPGMKHTYTLDDHHVFETGKPMLVCGNTAAMVQETRLARHFEVTGDRSTHFGLFDCGPDPINLVADSTGACC